MGQPLNAALSGSSSILISPWGRFCVLSVGNKSILSEEEKGFVLFRILITLRTLESPGTKKSELATRWRQTPSLHMIFLYRPERGFPRLNGSPGVPGQRADPPRGMGERGALSQTL